MKDKEKRIPMTKEEEYRNADVPMPEEEITSKDYYAPGSSFIQDQEEYNKQKAHNKFLKDLDFVRYEEHAEEEYKKHLKKFFKGDKC